MRRNKNPIVKKSNKKKKIILSATAIIVLAGVLTITELTDTTTLLHERKAVSSTIAKASNPKDDKNGVPSGDKLDNASSQSSAPESTPNPGSPKEGDTPTNNGSSAALIEPYGNFVSNHTPGKNGSPSVITSVCVTTPGAKCTITFTSAANPAVVKTLEAGTAGADGAVYWNNWDVRAAGFTNGAGNIKANATLNGQTKSAADSIAFEVQL